MAAISKTQIANLALSHIHAKGTVENIETEKSTEAKTANLWYDPARRQALADFDFGFSRKRQTLALHLEDPPEGEWAFRYQWPADAVAPRFIQNPLGRGKPPIIFEIEQASDGTQSILTNAEEAVLVYTKDATDPTFFTPHFVLALSYLLAHYIAGPLTSKKSLKDQAIENYNNAINVGAAHEANVTQAGTAGDPEAEWIRER